MLLTSPVVPSGLFFTQRFTGRNPATTSSDRVCLSGSVHIAANEVTSGVARGPSCPDQLHVSFWPIADVRIVTLANNFKTKATTWGHHGLKHAQPPLPSNAKRVPV